MKNFEELNRQEQEAFLMLPILQELKKAGGEATTKEVKRAVVANNDALPVNILTKTKKSRKGNIYIPFNFPFNFAVTNLVMAGYLERPHQGTIVLTQLGRQFSGSSDQLIHQVYELSLPIWEKRSEHNHHIQANAVIPEKVELDAQSEDQEDTDSNNWRTKLLDALENLTPAKFEMFCRALIKKMNVNVDESIGVKLSGDGGLDGYGYLTTSDFRTTRVAIQAKRWATNHLVSSPEIDKFRGAMDKFRAEYGIFVTTSSFTRDAIRASRTGTRVITLIDGDRLVDLVAKYQLYVKQVTTYELGSFFKKKD